MKKRIALFLALVLALVIISPASAQDYYFAVEKEAVHVYWNAEGTMSLEYTWVFANQPSGHAIEYVDVGMPNSNFDMSTISAEVNGASVSVSRGDYAGDGSGFAVVLGGHSIPPGQKGTVHVYVGRISNVLYNDDQDEAYASAVFAPTFFGSQYVTGSTDFTVTFHLPTGIQTEEPRWHSAPPGFLSEPQTGLDENGRVTYTWYSPTANAHTQYKFGASFPKSYIPSTSIITPPAAPSFLDQVGFFIS